jgi:gas vesicle protein
MRSVLNFLIGMLSGALFGAALAVLFAPISGDELRQQINIRVQGIQSEIEKAATQRRAELESQLDTLRAVRRGS